MLLGRVTGTVVASQKEPLMEGLTLGLRTMLCIMVRSNRSVDRPATEAQA